MNVLESKTYPKININNYSIGLILCYEENFQEIFLKQINKNNAEVFFVIGN